MAVSSGCWLPEMCLGEFLHLCGARWLANSLIIVAKRPEILLVFVLQLEFKTLQGMIVLNSVC